MKLLLLNAKRPTPGPPSERCFQRHFDANVFENKVPDTGPSQRGRICVQCSNATPTLSQRYFENWAGRPDEPCSIERYLQRNSNATSTLTNVFASSSQARVNHT